MYLSRFFIIIIFLCTSFACDKGDSLITKVEVPFEKPIKSTPILQINQGGHKASIRNIVFTPDGRYLVSAGEDKVIRVWDLETERTVRTLRGQIGKGSNGKIYAMSLSPDGRWLAVGGWMHSECPGRCGDIRLYDFNSGKIISLLKGHVDAVTALDFSPDSRYLVSGSGDNNAIIWNISPKPQLLHTLRGHTNRLYTVAFTPDSKRVVTGSDDHSLRLWGVKNGALIAILKGHTDKVRAIAISPQDGIIASGSVDNRIRLWNGQTGRLIKILANQKTQVGSLSFSADGRYLLSGVGEGGTNNNCYIWSIPDGRVISTYTGHDNIVLATATNGQWAATGGGNSHEIHIWSLRDGKLKKRLRGVGASIWAVGFSKDGNSLAWGKTTQSEWQVNNYGSLEYQIRLPSSERPLGTPRLLNNSNNFLRAKTRSGNWSLYAQNSQLEIRDQNRTVASIKRSSANGYLHRSYTFTPDGQTIISGGGNGYLTAYQRNGKQLGQFVGHTGDVWAVAISPDGRLLASAGDDQTVRLWELQSRKNILTLFHGNNGEWVAWTPNGHYTASPNGDNMVGWQINRGWGKAADYVKAAQLRHKLYNPYTVAKAVRLDTVEPTPAPVIKTLSTVDLPKFQVASPQNNSSTNQRQLELVLSFEANPHPVKTIEVYVNDSLVITRGKRVLPKIANEHRKTLKIPLIKVGKNNLHIVAKNSVGETAKDWIVHLTSGTEKKGNLYLVAVGVSDYQDDNLDLQYAATDANALHELILAQEGKAYEKVQSVLLTDDTEIPTSSKIKQALQLFSQVQENDTVILFIAGHGVNEDGEYYFLAKNAKMQQNGWQKSSVLKWQIFQNILENTPGRRIFLVDTCHAAKAINPRLVKDAADAKIVVISATDKNSVAQELPELKHGVFTYALLKGLKGEADYSQDKRLKIKELDSYLSNKIEELTNKTQIPVLHAPGGFKDFVFAWLK